MSLRCMANIELRKQRTEQNRTEQSRLILLFLVMLCVVQARDLGFEIAAARAEELQQMMDKAAEDTVGDKHMPVGIPPQRAKIAVVKPYPKASPFMPGKALESTPSVCPYGMSVMLLQHVNRALRACQSCSQRTSTMAAGECMQGLCKTSGIAIGVHACCCTICYFTEAQGQGTTRDFLL